MHFKQYTAILMQAGSLFGRIPQVSKLWLLHFCCSSQFVSAP